MRMSGVTSQPIGIGHPAIALCTIPALETALQSLNTMSGMTAKKCRKLFCCGNSISSTVDLSIEQWLGIGGRSLLQAGRRNHQMIEIVQVH